MNCTKIEELRKQFDKFLESKNCDMTNIEVIKRARETENLLFSEMKKIER